MKGWPTNRFSATPGKMPPPSIPSRRGQRGGWKKEGEESNHTFRYEKSLGQDPLTARRVELSQHPNTKTGLDYIEIGIASPEQIRKWAERKLSTGTVAGRVENADTVEYKTHRPIRDGLFCERIFGPVIDNSCACGEVTVSKPLPRVKDVFFVCPKCEVEPTSSSVRRVRLGYIQLFSSVTHIWYWRGHGQPNHITDLLGIAKKEKSWGENLVDCHTFLLESERAPDIVLSLREDSTLIPRRHPRGGVSPKATMKGPVASFRKRSRPRGDGRKGSSGPWTQAGRAYNRSHTFPFRPLFTCCLAEREAFLGYLGETPNREDRPILHYCQIKRASLTTSFSDLLTSHPMNPQQAAQEVLCHTGGEAIRHLLGKVDLTVLRRNLEHSLFELSMHIGEATGRRRKKLLRHRVVVIRRIKLASSLIRAGKRPDWMLLSNFPVLPPDLRPIIRTADGIIATSDLNGLYRKILFANKGLQKLCIPTVNTLCLAKRSLQEAVDALIENGKGRGKVVIDHNTGHPLKSLSALLKGKKGRFRHHLLGKRVDYSGRSVIVVGPTLKLHQCGLPWEMAIELFHPFLLRQVHRSNLAYSVSSAKRYLERIQRRRKQRLIWRLLERVMEHHPVLLNRAPTLHRLGIQAFQPILVQGRAIYLHPLVCTAFNADFDGDQMGVHIPLSFHARAEAWMVLWSPNHILSPATGQPILVPSQDMVLGCYYITSFDRRKAFNRVNERAPYFANVRDAAGAYTDGHIALHTPLWVRFAGIFQSQTNSEEPLEVRLHSNGKCLSIRSELQKIIAKNGMESRLVGRYIRTTAGRILMHDVTCRVQ